MKHSITTTVSTALLAMTWLGPMDPVAAGAAQRPNIVWLVIDDMSANFSCYGEKSIQTPHMDQLAAEGLRFTRAYATSPVCSNSRKSNYWTTRTNQQSEKP